MGQVVSTVAADDGKLDAPGKLPMVFQLQAVQEASPVCMILRVRVVGSLVAPVRLFGGGCDQKRCRWYWFGRAVLVGVPGV